MDLNNDNSQIQQQNNAKPSARRVEDDSNLEEKDLERGFLVDKDKEKHVGDPGMEGTGMGGESFNKNNVTPSGDDKDNHSQNAGYTNDYFKRTEPAEEHPENSNFKTEQQSGKPDYSQAQPNGDQEKSDGNQENNQPKQNDYQEGTVDNDKPEDVNVPRPE